MAHSKLKHGLLIGLAGLGVFGASAVTTFFVVPQKVITRNVENNHNNGENHVLTGQERFIGNLANQASTGLSFEINHLKFDQSYVGENAKTGHNTITVTEDAPATLRFAMSNLSLHGVNFALTAPLTYSNNGVNAKHRGIHAALVNDEIYLNLFDNGNDVADVVNNQLERSAGGTWDFKYKVSTAAKDIQVAEEDQDALTRGFYQYEYGDLDWLLEDVLSILSEGGINVSLEGWLNKLTSGSETSSESESASNGISLDDITASMNRMVEKKVDGKPYFIWNLPLGDMNLPLGFGSDASYNLARVDLPAKVSADDSAPLEAWTIQDGLSLSLSAKVSTEAIEDWSDAVYGDPADYHDLRNSAGLFEEVAKVVSKPQIGLSGSFTIGHEEDAIEGTRTKLRKKAVDEDAKIELSANLDAFAAAEPIADSKRELQGIDASLVIGKVDQPNEEPTAKNKIGVAYLKEDEEFNGYLNVNEVLKAKTSKTYLDEFYSEVLEDTFSSSEDGISLDQLSGIVDLLGDDVKKIQESDLVKAIQEGSFPTALDLLSSFVGGDNTIAINLSFAPLGIEGTASVVLDGAANHDLLSLTISNLKLLSFTLNGELHTSAFVAPSKPAFAENPAEYQELSHLKGIGGQIKDIVNEKSFGMDLGLTMANATETTLDAQGKVQLSFGEQKEGNVGLKLIHKAKSYTAQHNAVIDLKNDFQDIAFHYDSYKDDDRVDTSAKSADGINGKMSLASAKEVFSQEQDFDLQEILTIFKGDDRFSRLGAALMGESSASLISQIMNRQYFGLLENHAILSQVDIASDHTLVVLDGAKLGLDATTITIDVVYETPAEGEGGIASLNVQIARAGSQDQEARTIALSLSNIAPLGETSIAHLDDTNFDDYSPLATLGRDLVHTLTLGDYVNEGKVQGASNYAIHGAIDLDIAGYGTTLYDFDAKAYVEGAETKLYAELADFPVIRGVNGPDSDTYFRPNELEGVRTSEIYFYANGVDPEGQVLLTRDSSYGRLRNVQDAVRLQGKDLTDDLLGWLGEYALGLDASLFEKEESESTTESSGMAIHLDDAWVGFTHDDHTYEIALNLGDLLGISILDEVKLTFETKSVTSTNYSKEIVSGLVVSLAVAPKATDAENQVHKMKLASAEVSLRLTNFAGADHAVTSVFGEDSRFAQAFVGTVSEDGLIDEDGETGALYLIQNGFQSAIANPNPHAGFDNYYGYDFSQGVGDFAGRNLYLGI
ncbi:MAG: hypothetical protein IJU64_00640 [Bacilli bacterium]|nr:hypothetical protein [Bacilli bacterium]